MNDDKRKEIGVFKYGLIVPVISGNVKVQMEYFREIAKKEYDVPFTGQRKYDNLVKSPYQSCLTQSDIQNLLILLDSGFRRNDVKGDIQTFYETVKYKARTFKSWLRRNRKNGFDALIPKKRIDKGTSRKVDDQFAGCIKEKICRFPFLPCAAIYRMLVAERNIRLYEAESYRLFA